MTIYYGSLDLSKNASCCFYGDLSTSCFDVVENVTRAARSSGAI